MFFSFQEGCLVVDFLLCCIFLEGKKRVRGVIRHLPTLSFENYDEPSRSFDRLFLA